MHLRYFEKLTCIGSSNISSCISCFYFLVLVITALRSTDLSFNPYQLWLDQHLLKIKDYMFIILHWSISKKNHSSIFHLFGCSANRIFILATCTTNSTHLCILIVSNKKILIMKRCLNLNLLHERTLRPGWTSALFLDKNLKKQYSTKLRGLL